MKMQRNTDFDFDVRSREQLKAAVRAMAQPTHREAALHPGRVRLGSATYNFPEGVTERRAEKIAANINKYPKGAFHVTETFSPVVQPSEHVRELPSEIRLSLRDEVRQG